MIWIKFCDTLIYIHNHPITDWRLKMSKKKKGGTKVIPVTLDSSLDFPRIDGQIV